VEVCDTATGGEDMGGKVHGRRLTFTGPGTGSPRPTGAFTKSRKSAVGKEAYRLAALAVSMTEPPPTAR
jgi:hypothetical protein